MTQEQYEKMYNWVYEEIHHNRDSYSRSKIIAMIMHKAGKLVNENNDIHDVTNRYLIEYLNKGGACRQTYIDAINKEAAHKAFFIYNDGTITSITDICRL